MRISLAFYKVFYIIKSSMSKSTDTVTEMRKKERKRQLTYRLVGSALLCASQFFATVILGKAGVADSGVDFKTVGLYLGASTVLMGVYGLVVSIITSIIVNFYNEVKFEPEADEVPPPTPAHCPKSLRLPPPSRTARRVLDGVFRRAKHNAIWLLPNRI